MPEGFALRISIDPTEPYCLNLLAAQAVTKFGNDAGAHTPALELLLHHEKANKGSLRIGIGGDQAMTATSYSPSKKPR